MVWLGYYREYADFAYHYAGSFPRVQHSHHLRDPLMKKIPNVALFRHSRTTARCRTKHWNVTTACSQGQARARGLAKATISVETGWRSIPFCCLRRLHANHFGVRPNLSRRLLKNRIENSRNSGSRFKIRFFVAPGWKRGERNKENSQSCDADGLGYDRWDLSRYASRLVLARTALMCPKWRVCSLSTLGLH
jgi:hypothetical protein